VDSSWIFFNLGLRSSSYCCIAAVTSFRLGFPSVWVFATPWIALASAMESSIAEVPPIAALGVTWDLLDLSWHEGVGMVIPYARRHQSGLFARRRNARGLLPLEISNDLGPGSAKDLSTTGPYGHLQGAVTTH